MGPAAHGSICQGHCISALLQRRLVRADAGFLRRRALLAPARGCGDCAGAAGRMAGESETAGLGSRHRLVRSLGEEPEPSAPPSAPVILRRKHRPGIGGSASEIQVRPIPQPHVLLVHLPPLRDYGILQEQTPQGRLGEVSSLGANWRKARSRKARSW